MAKGNAFGTAEDARSGRGFARYLPLLALAAGFAAFFVFRLDRYVSFDALREHREALLTWVGGHAASAAAVFIVVYAVAIATSIPGGLVLSVAGGFLFGTWLGSIYIVIGATLGATAIFLAARTALRDILARRAGPAIRKMEAGFREDAFSYMLVLRLVPLFPFWLVNLVPALLGVPLRTYVAATAVGIIPGTVVFASVGNGLGAIFDQGGTPDASVVLRPEILLPLIGLALLSLIPVVYKRIKPRKGG
ncbi:MAG: TVP38/TMEM64 family protein [Alphaproteobacteria bacterium]